MSLDLCVVSPRLWAGDGEQVSQCQGGVVLKASELTARQGLYDGEELSLLEGSLAPCEALEGWLALRGRRFVFNGAQLRVEEPRLTLMERVSLPLPELRLHRDQPWRWLRLPKAGWSEGAPWLSVPLSVPIGESGGLSPSLGWWGGATFGLGLTVDQGSAALLWAARRGGVLDAQLSRVAPRAGGVNAWLMGRWASRPLNGAQGGGVGWAARAVRGRDELWGGGSVALSTSTDLRWISAHLSPLAGSRLSVSEARLAWSSLSKDQRLHLALAGALRRGERLGQRATLAGRYERQAWLGVTRLRGVARAEGQAASEEGARTSSERGWLWLTLGAGTRGERHAAGGLSGLDLELQAELVASGVGSALEGAHPTLAPSWAQLETRAPSLGRAGLKLEWARRWLKGAPSQRSAEEITWSVWSGVGQLELGAPSVISGRPHLVVTSDLSGSWSALGLGGRVDLEVGLARGEDEVEGWGGGELRVGARWWSSGRLMTGAASPLMWGLARLGQPLRMTTKAGHTPSLSERLSAAVAAGYLGAHSSMTLSAWSQRVVMLEVRIEVPCACWGLSGAAAWADQVGTQLSLSVDLGRGG